MRQHLLTTCSVLCMLVSLPVVTHAADAISDELSPRAEVSVKGGSERSVLTTEFWAPLAQQSGRVLYGDLRLMGDNDDNREGNLGFGYRQISETTNSVLGGHLWIDRRRTEHNNTFHQITIGAESLGTVIDLRANAYIPLNSGNTVTTPNLGSTTPYLAGSGLFYDTNGSISETPQYGADAEIGYRLPILQKYADTIRIYGGGYSFFRENTDSVNGYRVRTEAVINSIFSVGARFQHDAPRGDQGFLEATIRFPFSAKKLYQTKGLYGRLDESPERDVDIVTAAKVDNGQRQLLNAAGDAQRILYVDNTVAAGGDGTKENPFNNLASAQAAIKANDILYVARGNGTTSGMDQGITISQNNVQLIGSGSALTVQGITFLNAGAAPTLTNTQAAVSGSNTLYDNSANVILVKADNALITGITTTGAQHSGIMVLAENGQVINNVTITSNTATGSIGDAGIVLKTNDGGIINNATISNNNASNNTGIYGNGIFARTQGTGGYIGNLTITGNTVSNNYQNGISISTLAAGSTIGTITVTGNTANATIGGSGIQINALANTSIGSVNIQNNTANDNQYLGQTTSNINARGVFVIANGVNSTINDLIIKNNTTSNNANDGIRTEANTSGRINTITIDGNTSNSNQNAGGNAIDLQTNNNGTIGTANITNNTTIGNSQATVGVYLTTGGVDTINISNIIGSANKTGIQFITGSGARLNQVNVSNFTFVGNGTSDGLRFNVDGTGSSIGSVTGSNINLQNSRYGFYTNLSTGGTISSIDISSMTIQNSTQTGAFVYIATNSTIGQISLSNTTIANSVLQGIGINAVSGSTIGTINLNSVTTLNNASDGTFIYTANASSLINQVNVNNLVSTNNSFNGLLVRADTGATINNTVVNSIQTNNNKNSGIYILANGGTMNTVAMSGITANNNTQQGIFTTAQSGSTIGTLMVSSSNTANNVQSGIYTTVFSGATINSYTATGNTSATNGIYGYYTRSNGAGSKITTANFSNNTATGHVSQGFYTVAQTGASIGTLTLNANTSNANTQTGFTVYANGGTITSAVLTNNTANNNTTANGNGFNITADTAGSVSAMLQHNTATGNASNGLAIFNNSSTTFVVDAGGGALGSTGQNRIWNNTLQEVRINSYALLARTNYWGGGDLTVGEKNLGGTSPSVDSTGFLTVDPGP